MRTDLIPVSVIAAVALFFCVAGIVHRIRGRYLFPSNAGRATSFYDTLCMLLLPIASLVLVTSLRLMDDPVQLVLCVVVSYPIGKWAGRRGIKARNDLQQDGVNE